MRRPHIVVVTRWRERYAEFDRYADHARNCVTYVATEVGLGSVPPSATDVWLVPATDDLDAVRAGVHALATRYGPPARIVALKEDDLLIGARLREEWQCPGPRWADLLPLRDKLLMNSRVAAHGLPIDAFAAAPDQSAIRGFADRHGWPVILKPTMGSASEGVRRLDGPGDLATVEPATGPRLVQSFNPNPVYHVDGLFAQSRLVRWRAARYLNTCLDFRGGAPLGSVEEDNSQLAARIGRATLAFLRALTGRPTVFHLEMFVDPAGGCRFLEAGARVGGGETALLWRDVHGFDLAQRAFAIQCGTPVEDTADAMAGHDVAGHLLVPAPAGRPCRITASTSMLASVPGLYAEDVPAVGSVVPAADSYYEHVGGRFRFRASSTRAVMAAIAQTVADYGVTGEPLDAVAAGSASGHRLVEH
jgi:biotin carboxylase